MIDGVQKTGLLSAPLEKNTRSIQQYTTSVPDRQEGIQIFVLIFLPAGHALERGALFLNIQSLEGDECPLCMCFFSIHVAFLMG